MIAHVIQVGLELSIFQPWTLKCWNYSGMPVHLAPNNYGEKTNWGQWDGAAGKDLSDRPSGPSWMVGTHIEEGES